MKRIAAIALLLLAALVPASAEMLVNFDAPFAATVPTCSETADINGTAHIVLHITADGAGGGHGALHINAQAAGTGATSGAKYQGGAVLNGHLNLNSGGAGNLSVVANLRMIGQGKVPNFRLKLQLHLTANANGDLTATVGNISAECK